MRILAGAVAIAACLFVMQLAASFGLSRLLSRYALLASSVPAADEAVRLSPSDPDAHRTRAVVLTRLKQHADAAIAFETATNLRYRDDYLWIDLGNAREEIGDRAGALVALDQAVRWAPYYAHTHWQRGNLLLRVGRIPEAFAELRTAATANPRYHASLIDLAWGVSREDVAAAVELIGIRDDVERLAFIRFLARKGRGGDVRAQIKLLTNPLTKERQDQVVRQLFAAKAFKDAFELWRSSGDTGLLFNPGFEEPDVLVEPGFGGWLQCPGQSKVRLSIDVNERFSGERSLQVFCDGDWDPATAVLSQTIPVGPSQTYRVTFSVKTKDLVSGGPPLLTVSDATGNELLGKSETFPATSSWVRLSFEFTTLATSEAAVIRLQRNGCEPAPCPIFGTFWVDDISIKRI